MPRKDPAVEGDAARRTTGATVLVGSAWTTVSLLLPQFYLIALSVVAARYLGPDAMGRQSFIAFVALSLVMVLTGGLPASLQRFVGETLGRGRPEHVLDLIGWAWRLVAPAAVIGAGALIAAAALGSTPPAAWILAGAICALGVAQTVPASVLRGMQQWRGVALLGIVTGAVSVIATLVVLAAGGGIVGMFAVELAVTLVNVLVSVKLARVAVAALDARAERSPELRRRAGRWALVGTFGILLTLVVWRRSEFFFLEAYSSDREIAMYSIAFAAVTALTRFADAVGTVLSPAFATLYGAGRLDRMRSGYGRGARLMLLVALPMTASAVALAQPAVRVVYGSAYDRAGDLLVLMALPLPLMSLVSVSRGLIFGLGHQRVLIAAGVIAAVTDIALAFLLIPRHEALGAVAASAAAQAAAAIVYVAYSSHAVGGVPWAPRELLRTAVAAAAAGTAAWLVASALPDLAGLAAGATAFLAVFALLGIVLRVVPADDAAWLEDAVGARMGQRARVPRAWLRAASGRSPR